jgi:nitrogen regulatory protein PII
MALKEIRAYIQPFMLPKLTVALLDIPEFPGMSVSDCEGFGRTKVSSSQDFTPFMSKKRIEIFAPDSLVDRIVTTILQVANTHQPGAGVVYVLDVLQGTRIRTGEQEGKSRI